MLYLEDYLEMIEHLPQELRDRFTEMRELDLTVQNNMDSLDKKSRNFFSQCKRGELLFDSADTEFHHLRREYYKVMEDAEEKVAIATQVHELVERYLRRLDSELFKFKCELEADNNGITEILEKRSLELDGHGSSNSNTSNVLLMGMNQKENRYYGAPSHMTSSIMSHSGHSSAGILTANTLSLGGTPTNYIGITVGTGVINNSSSVLNNSSGVTTSTSGLTNAHPHSYAAHIQQRQRKLEKRRETICTMTVPEKRPNLNHSLPSTHITANSHAMSTSVRPITSNLPPHPHPHPHTHPHTHTHPHSHPHPQSHPHPHPVLATNTASAAAAAATTVIPTTTVTYNLQQLGSTATSAIAAAASQAIVATQQMQQGRRTASLKASYEAIHGGAGVGASEFWIANAANATAVAAAHTNTSTLPSSSGTSGGGGAATVGAGAVVAGGHHHHHHQHHHEKKQKKKITHHQHSMTIAANVAISNLTGTTSTSIASSTSSTMSVDSIEIISSSAGTTVIGLGNTGALTSGTVSSSVLIGNSVNPSIGIHHVTNTTPSISVTPIVHGNAQLQVTGNTINNTTVVPSSSSTSTSSSAVNTLPSTSIAPAANITLNENGIIVEQANDGEWSYDPNEPRYCTCNQVSYGDMVACDNDACPYEWFHYPCVGITQPPKGKWYCPKCTTSMRRRANRKN